jgi:hypothetical protein
MDKKPLIGVSILTMVLLVLASLCNVVGYQSVKSTVSDSPLFTIRKNRATSNENIGGITSNFLGKGATSLIMISKRTDAIEKVRDVIERIQYMDENTFKKLVDIIVKEFPQQGKTDNVDLHKILYEVHQIRSLPKTSMGNGEYQNVELTMQYSPTLCFWFPGCLVIGITAFTLFVVFFLGWLLIFPTTFPTCDPMGCPGK